MVCYVTDILVTYLKPFIVYILCLILDIAIRVSPTVSNIASKMSRILDIIVKVPDAMTYIWGVVLISYVHIMDFMDLVFKKTAAIANPKHDYKRCTLHQDSNGNFTQMMADYAHAIDKIKTNGTLMGCP